MDQKEPVRQFKAVLSFAEEPGWEPDVGKFSHPWGVAVNERNEIAVSDTGNNRVQIFSSDGSFIRKFGSHRGFKTDRPGEFDFPTGIVYHSNGNLTVADTKNHRIQIFSAEGEYLSQFGEEGSLDHQLNDPYGLSLDSDGNIIVADTANKLIKIFSPSGKFLRKLGGEGTLNFASHCIQQGQYLLVSDNGDHCIKIFDLKGNYLYKFGQQGDGDGEFKSPRCMSVNQEGHLMVCDTENHRVQVFEKDGKFVTKFGKHGQDMGEFHFPVSIAVQTDGRIVISDFYNSRIQIFQQNIFHFDKGVK